MEKNHKIIEPHFEGEVMHMPETIKKSAPIVVSEQRFLSAPIIILLFLILVAILGGFYYWYTLVMSEQLQPTKTVRPTAEQNNEPESTTAEARTGLMNVVSTSDDLGAIEADANSTNLDDIANEISPLETDLNAAISAQ